MLTYEELLEILEMADLLTKPYKIVDQLREDKQRATIGNAIREIELLYDCSLSGSEIDVLISTYIGYISAKDLPCANIFKRLYFRLRNYLTDKFHL